MICPYCGKRFFRYHSECPSCKTELAEKGIARFWMGAFGAALGAFIGFTAVVFLDLVSVPMYLAGLVVGLCIPIGWRLMGERLTGVGILICILLMVLTVYCANRTALAIAFMRWIKEIPMQISFGQAYASIPGLLRGDLVYGGRDFAINPRIYYNRLVLTYSVTAVGGFAYLIPVWGEDNTIS